MSRFSAPPPDGESRKAIEQRARDATRPAAPEKKGTWPFSVEKNPSSNGRESSPAASTGREKV
ncbi:MAG: hypothetical protein JWR68_2693 [Polaromonas sp.]|nr:hypothetical protein [Polaromonas sp.]